MELLKRHYSGKDKETLPSDILMVECIVTTLLIAILSGHQKKATAYGEGEKFFCRRTWSEKYMQLPRVKIQETT